MSTLKRRLLLLSLAAVSACSKPDAATTVAINEISESNAVDANLATADLPTLPPLEATHHYQDKEGDRYFYVTEVSDEDKQKGQAVGQVVQYRYLGLVDGLVTLQDVSEAGDTLGTLTCARDCRIMKLVVPSGGVSRLPFDPSSIAGAAMQDALSGFLQVAEPKRSSRSAPPHPTDTSSPPSAPVEGSNESDG